MFVPKPLILILKAVDSFLNEGLFCDRDVTLTMFLYLDNDSSSRI